MINLLEKNIWSDDSNKPNQNVQDTNMNINCQSFVPKTYINFGNNDNRFYAVEKNNSETSRFFNNE